MFYGGYALHSTLLRYDNTPYDNRVETMISHGCVRLHKSDIDWIAARLPIGSRHICNRIIQNITRVT